MRDRARSSGDFLELSLRDGRAVLIHNSDIKQIRARSEGGVAIRQKNEHVILLDCEINEVAAAMRGDDWGSHAKHTA